MCTAWLSLAATRQWREYSSEPPQARTMAAGADLGFTALVTAFVPEACTRDRLLAVIELLKLGLMPFPKCFSTGRDGRS